MAFDEAALHEAYDLATLHVRSSTQISSRTASIVSRLDGLEHAKPPLIVLTADAKAAGKLISIVEIAKRELAAKNVKIHQYNGLSSKLVEIDRHPKSKKSTPENTSRGDDDDDESEDAFETAGEVVEPPTTKTRNMPVMTIYLAGAPVRELRAVFGEQA